ncbi:MAG TPA: hypothetical protein VJC09_00760 [Candidatus Saccharimonadales bacterium]|nr:hypothetical protein [Candidatus Saccharimonadales bacterium]
MLFGDFALEREATLMEALEVVRNASIDLPGAFVGYVDESGDYIEKMPEQFADDSPEPAITVIHHSEPEIERTRINATIATQSPNGVRKHFTGKVFQNVRRDNAKVAITGDVEIHKYLPNGEEVIKISSSPHLALRIAHIVAAQRARIASAEQKRAGDSDSVVS